MASAAQIERRLYEILQVLAGERGAPGKRAVRLEEVQAILQQQGDGASAAAIQQIADTAQAQGIQINQILVDLVAVNAKADQAIEDIQALVDTLPDEFGDLIADMDAINAAVTQVQTIRDQVEGFRDQASAHATTATTQAGIAVSSATAAGNSATAASSSETNAFAAADAASTDAGIAQEQRILAQTARGQAQTAATNAASSASSAAGSASQASTSATLSATAFTDAVNAINAAPALPSDFRNGARHWVGVHPDTRGGDPKTVPDAAVTVIPNDSVFGAAVEMTSVVAGRNILTKGLVPWGGGRVYRVTVRFRVTESNEADAQLNIIVARNTAEYENTAYAATESVVVPSNGTEQVFSRVISDFSGPGIDNDFASAGFPWVRFGIRNARNNSTITVRVGSILVEDITAGYQANIAAQAASESATVASAQATAASQSASVANAQRITAETAASNSSVARDQAVNAATNAGESAALAGERLEISASITAQGLGVLRDTFLAVQSGQQWYRTASQGTLAQFPNTVFTVGMDWRFTILPGQRDGVATDSRRSIWRGPANADIYAIEVDYTLESGSLDGAGIRLQWLNTSGTSWTVDARLDDASAGPVVIGQVMTARMIAERPSNFSGTFDYHRVYAFANHANASMGDAAKVIRFHRLSIRVVTDAEERLIEAEANISQESIARANADAALATSINTVETNLNGVSSSVSQQASAISTLEGNAASLLAFRAKAGSAGAQLELVAADGPGGPTSIARIDASEIILNASIVNAQIADFAVSTLKIGENQVTFTAAVENLDFLDFEQSDFPNYVPPLPGPGNPYQADPPISIMQQVASLSFPSTGRPVLINVGAIVKGFVNGGAFPSQNKVWYPSFAVANGGDRLRAFREVAFYGESHLIFSTSIVQTLPQGVNNIRLMFYSRPSDMQSGDVFEVSRRYISAVEVKR